MRSVRLALRRLVPAEVRLQISRTRNYANRRRKGQQRRLARKSSTRFHEAVQMTVSQPIFKTELSANKIQNLKRAAAEIDEVVVPPDKIFSFWNIVPRPTKANGFSEGRSLIDGELVGEFGGGLCQLSGIIYQVSLLAGLNCLERHAHSVDLYTEETRFAPLGSDATVVYGYKDLLVENTLPSPLKFEFDIEENSLTCRLLCASEIERVELSTEVQNYAHGKQVIVKRVAVNGLSEIISEDFYRSPIERPTV